MLLPGNSIPAPGEEQCRCSRTSPGERLQAALLFIFFSIVSYVCTEFWVLHRREPGPALDWVPGACGILVCVGPHFSPVAPCHHPSSQGTRQVVFCSRSGF